MNSPRISVERVQLVLNRNWFAVVVPAVIGLGLATLIVRALNDYGWSLFLGLPLVVSFLSSFCYSFRREVTLGAAYRRVVLSILLLGVLILLIALDGAICLLMALPLTLVIALLGTLLGNFAGCACRGVAGTSAPLLLVLMLPGATAVEHATRPPPELRTVTTSVVIAAPAKRVWPAVISFSPIGEPPTGLFRWGIAYPTEARIEGTGVGAIRHCVFSTGSFEEPITAWEEPTRLAFDVVSCPPPMKELSIYRHVDAPHLHGFMVSERGQFRLIERDGGVVLEGTTWYRHDLSPGWYWGPLSDYIIHRIHERVLHHIQRTIESG
jgi:hypothetical protein